MPARSLSCRPKRSIERRRLSSSEGAVSSGGRGGASSATRVLRSTAARSRSALPGRSPRRVGAHLRIARSVTHGAPTFLRRLVLRRFPVSIFYRELANAIHVVAVAPHKRRPGYWAERV